MKIYFPLFFITLSLLGISEYKLQEARKELATLKPLEVNHTITPFELQEQLNTKLPPDEQLKVDGIVGEATLTAWDRVCNKEVTDEIYRKNNKEKYDEH